MRSVRSGDATLTGPFGWMKIAAPGASRDGKVEVASGAGHCELQPAPGPPYVATVAVAGQAPSNGNVSKPGQAWNPPLSIVAIVAPAVGSTNSPITLSVPG